MAFPHKPADFRSDYTDEEYAADIFLNGYCRVTRDGQFLRIEYLTGTDEQLGRKMLAQVLRGEKGPPRELLQDLADLFDPESENPRKLAFQNRSKGHSNPHRDRAIACFVQAEMKRSGRQKNDVVVNDAVPHFRLTREKVYEALRRDKKRFPHLHD